MRISYGPPERDYVGTPDRAWLESIDRGTSKYANLNAPIAAKPGNYRVNPQTSTGSCRFWSSAVDWPQRAGSARIRPSMNRGTRPLRTALLVAVLVAAAGPHCLIAAETPGYRDVEITVPTADPEVTLAGTLSLPAGDGPHPGILFLTGSGGHTRDQVISGLPMFRVLGEYLAARGLAVLRVDDRGAGKSTGPNVRESTMDERAADARAAFEYLLARPEVDAAHTGLLGHSEGAMTGPRLAVEGARAAFLVLLAPPSVPGADLWVRQQGDILRRDGEMPEAQIQEIETALGRMVRHIGSEGNTDEGFYEHGRAACLAWGDPPDDVTPEFVTEAFGDLRQSWYVQFFSSDPEQSLRRLRTPLLAVFAGADQQVPPTLNLPVLADRLMEAGNDDFTVTVLPDEDHFFMRKEGLAPNEHVHGEMELSTAVLEAVGGWLAERAGGARHPSDP